jgi:pimeloyl-ACP methyl ester carboxylesterase
MASFYAQQATWRPCEQAEGGCATIEAPMDYNNPGGERISVGIARVEATGPGEKVGSILINPGGPGASGIDYVSYMALTLPAEVLAVYDVIGFDPRGAGTTTPVTCLDDSGMDQYLNAWPDTLDTAGIKLLREEAEDFGEACLNETGEVLQFVDSGSTAMDMDLIRSAVGDSKLNYLGVSYGTYLGALYAERFPERVGHVVLDAAVDPTATQGEEEITQLVGFENSLRAYVEDCHSSSICPLTGTTDESLAQIHDFIAARQADPLPTSYDRPLTLPMALMGILVAMYEDMTWPVLSTALATAIELGDGTALLQLADVYYSRDSETGAFQDNMFEAFIAITCLDSPVDARRAEMEARMARLQELAPTLADFSAYGALGCAEWPFPAVLEPHTIAADGAAPIVVVGTTGDPATPYENAEALAGGLSSGVLVTWEGEGHGAVGRSNACVTDMLVSYYIDAKAPDPGLIC